MKNHKNNLGINEQFQKGMEVALKQYYLQALSENVKRAWRIKKKLSTLQNCNVKQCKV
jgi:hypothetical protein